jgi:hypothetical protein
MNTSEVEGAGKSAPPSARIFTREVNSVAAPCVTSLPVLNDEDFSAAAPKLDAVLQRSFLMLYILLSQEASEFIGSHV